VVESVREGDMEGRSLRLARIANTARSTGSILLLPGRRHSAADNRDLIPKGNSADSQPEHEIESTPPIQRPLLAWMHRSVMGEAGWKGLGRLSQGECDFRPMSVVLGRVGPRWRGVELVVSA
jgi:hypothetical protein